MHKDKGVFGEGAFQDNVDFLELRKRQETVWG